jgi:SpoVK/Ycf46/Vps4 family AAA+-type ATPase
MTKYIGETDKNLRHLFEAAENCGCNLLLDEADAPFGKRGGIEDFHDRYANWADRFRTGILKTRR